MLLTCLRSVAPTSSGICPACRNSMDAVGTLASDQGTVLIMEDEEMPDVCATCGADTPRRQEIYAEYEVKDDSSPNWQWFGLGWAGAILEHHRKKRNIKRKGCVIHLSVCETCASTPIKPLRVHFQDRKMQFVVHKVFQEAFTAIQNKYRA